VSGHCSRHHEQAIYERVRAMISRGELRAVHDDPKLQTVDVELWNGFKPTKVEHWHPYGIATHPKAGAEVIALALGGDIDHLVTIATADRRYRMKVAGGEVALHDDQGQFVHLKRAGIVVKSPGGVEIEAPTITLKGNIVHTGNMTTSGEHIDSNGKHV
jgi:phage baseplate assembly protein V